MSVIMSTHLSSSLVTVTRALFCSTHHCRISFSETEGRQRIRRRRRWRWRKKRNPKKKKEEETKARRQKETKEVGKEREAMACW